MSITYSLLPIISSVIPFLYEIVEECLVCCCNPFRTWGSVDNKVFGAWPVPRDFKHRRCFVYFLLCFVGVCEGAGACVVIGDLGGVALGSD